MGKREIVYKTGKDDDFLRSHICEIRKCGQGKKSKKVDLTNPGQAKLNQKNAERKLLDLLNHNFTPADIWLGLDYENEVTLEEALKMIKRFIARVQYMYRTRNLGKLKYIYTTEAGEENGRIHHHLVINWRGTPEELKEMWKAGTANYYKLQFDECGLMGIAKYICQNPEDRLTYRRWSCSKNLDKPQPKKNDYRIKARDAKYINEHPDDFAIVQKLYPGYIITKIETTADSFADISSPADTANDIKARGVFITIYGFKKDTKLFGRRRGGFVK